MKKTKKTRGRKVKPSKKQLAARKAFGKKGPKGAVRGRAGIPAATKNRQAISLADIMGAANQQSPAPQQAPQQAPQPMQNPMQQQ